MTNDLGNKVGPVCVGSHPISYAFFCSSDSSDMHVHNTYDVILQDETAQIAKFMGPT